MKNTLYQGGAAFRGCARTLLNASVAVLALTQAPIAYAQESLGTEEAADDALAGGTKKLDTVTVTARRREESLIETPIAVSVATGEQLRQADIVTAPDLTKLSPGLTAQIGANNSRRTSRFAIRGQGGSGAGVGVVSYFADVPEFGNSFYDLENVQVLKGPVGTLFGRVTTGGAVLFTPKMPGDEFEGSVNLKIGDYGRRDVEFAVGGPIIDDVLSFRVAGQLLKSDGFTNNLYDGSKQDGRDGQSYRGILKFTPTSRITNTTIGVLDYVQDPTRSGIITEVRPMIASIAGVLDRGNTQSIAPALAELNGIDCPGGVCPSWLELAQQAVDEQAGRSVYTSNENHVNNSFPNNRHVGIVNTTEFELTDNISIKNILSYQASDDLGPSSQNVDGLWLPMLEVAYVPRTGPRAYTEELQIQGTAFEDRIDFTAGYFHEKNWTPYYQGGSVILYGGYLGQSLSPALCAATGTRADPGDDGTTFCYSGARTSMTKVRDYDDALYAQVTWNVTEALSLTGGYRYTWSERERANQSVTSVDPRLLSGEIPSELAYVNGMPPVLVPSDVKHLPGESFTKLKFEEGTYSLAARYEFSDDLMVYATTRRGYNPGGSNNRAPAGRENFGPEIVTDYEIGVKSNFTLGDWAGLVSFDVYRDDFDDAQRNTTLPVNGVPTVYVANVAKIRIQGFDLDGTIARDWFSLGGFVTQTDAEYTEYPNTGQFPDYLPPFDLTTINPANVSEWTWGIRPSVDVGDLLDIDSRIVLSGNIYSRSDFSSSEPNLGPDAAKIVPGYTLGDVRIDWRNINNSDLSVGLAVTNVSDYNGKVGGNELRTTNGINVDVFAPPRAFFIEFDYDF